MQKMHMSTNSMAATAVGIAAASVAAGAAAYYMNVGSPKGKRRAMKKRTQRAMRTVTHAVGSAVDNMASSILG